MSAELHNKREELKVRLRQLKPMVEEARKTHEKLYKQFRELADEFEAIDRQIAEETKVIKCKPCLSPNHRPKQEDPKERMKRLMAGMSPAEKEAFIKDLLK